jgi:hypothetical protein
MTQGKSWWILVGERGLCIFCSQDRQEVETFRNNVVAYTRIFERDREYSRGEKVSGKFEDRILQMMADKRAEELASDAAGEVKLLSNSGNVVCRISATDCQNVAYYVNEGEDVRPGGFRDTIRLLMLAGF